MIIQGQVGPQVANDSAQTVIRTGRAGEAIFQELHGRYYEQTFRKNVFYGANAAGQVTTVGLATTYTGLVLFNPAGSTVNLVPISFGAPVTAGPAAASSIGLLAGFAAAGITSFTVTTNRGSTFIGSPQGSGVAAVSATLVGTPNYVLQANQIPITTEGQGNTYVELAGQIIIPPGGYIAIATVTVATILGHFIWEEVPQ